MRTSLARLTGLVAAGSLILGPLAVAGPASAVLPGYGSIAVRLVDDLGQPVVGAVQLFPSGGGAVVLLGLPEPDEDDDNPRPVTASSYVEDVPADTYGAMAVGGWGGVTCIGLSTCEAFEVDPLPAAGTFTVDEGGTTSLVLTVATPRLTGGSGIGLPLTVSVPSSLTELATTILGFPGVPPGLSIEPVVTWNRNGAPLGATGATYTPTTADVGSSISATVAYPAVVSSMFDATIPGTVPAPFTTAAVSIRKPTPSVQKLTPSIRLSVPGRVKQGKRPAAHVTVKLGRALVGGVVTFAVDKLRPQRRVLRSGLATFKLPKLKPGRHKVTASFAAVGAYNAAKVAKTVVVKGKKPKKGKKK